MVEATTHALSGGAPDAALKLLTRAETLCGLRADTSAVDGHALDTPHGLLPGGTLWRGLGFEGVKRVSAANRLHAGHLSVAVLRRHRVRGTIAHEKNCSCIVERLLFKLLKRLIVMSASKPRKASNYL